METIDPAKAARVWQRVHNDTPQAPPEQGLLELISQEWTDASTYLQLSRKFQGKQSAILRRLFEDEQSHTACLKGIYTLLTGRHPKVAVPELPKENPEQTLRRCYGREMQCLAQYEKRSSHPEYGPVFARLALQEQEHCRLVLELLGSLKRQT